MCGVSRLERGLRQATGVTRVARSLQPMDQNDLRNGLARWTLGVQQHLRAGFGLKKSSGYREPLEIQLARPVIAGDGGNMRISK